MKHDTISIHGWFDLRQFGIGMLTGEADRLSLRLLCDVSEEGRALVLDYLGLPENTVLTDAWNSSVDEAPAVGSILLHRNSLYEVAEFAMFRMGALATLHMGTQLMGVFNAERLAQYEQMANSSRDTALKAEIHRNCAISASAPGMGTRNTHLMSGRTV